MIYPDRKSALVRLSDCLKSAIESAANTTEAILSIYERHRAALEHARSLAALALKGRVSAEAPAEALQSVPDEDAREGARLQLTLHAQCLGASLLSCFCLESYANSFAYYYLDSFGARFDLTAFDEKRIQDKWAFLSRLKGGPGFDSSRAPFQHLKLLVRFRNDHVHDKPRNLSEDYGKSRYGGRLPDPVFGLLHLGHALFAANTYWSLALELHRLLALDTHQFHRHYNLAPWGDDEARDQLHAVADDYEQVLG